MRNKFTGVLVTTIIFIAIMTWFSAGCSQGKQVINGDNNIATTAKGIPAIDMLLPVKTETATFALG